MSTSASVSALMSPRAAIQSIISTYSNDHNGSTTASSTTARTNSRIRAERTYGEDITNSNLLEELKRKKQTKESKSNTTPTQTHRQYTRQKKN